MTTAVQLRRGTTAEHATFTGLEGETTVDTTKDTLVVHNGSTAGGFPIAREDLANVSPTNLPSITGADTASDDTFLIYDQSALTLKKITRAELNNAMEQDPLSNVQIVSGTINGTTIGGTTAAGGSFTTLNSSGATTLNGTTIPSSVTLVSTAATQTLTNKTISADDNTISGIAASSFVLSNASGNIDGAAAQKAIPSGVVVGTTDTQTLTNKTLTAPVISSIVNTGTLTLPTSTDTLVGRATTDTLTNKTISGDNNTLSNIGNSSLTNSSITFGSTAQALGSTVSALNDVSIGASTASTGAFTNLSYTGTLTGGTGVVNLGSGQFYKDASGNVGIGTSSPAYLLDVAGVTRVQVSRIAGEAAQALRLRTDGVTGDGVSIDFNVASADSTTARIASFRTAVTDAPGDLRFYTGPVGGLTERMHITSAGNVGIGTTSPSAASNQTILEVSNATGRGNIFTNTGAGDGAGVVVGSFGFVGGASTSNERTAGIFSLTEGATSGNRGGTLQFNTKANGGSLTERMRIDSAGNVGIGTSSPGCSLQVNGGIRARGGAPGALGVNNNGFAFSGNSGDVDGGMFSSADGQVEFYTDSVERMRINSSGNVGIGTSSPACALDVSGQIAGKYENVGTNTAAQNLAVNKVSQVVISANTTLTTTVPPAGATACVIIQTSGTTSRTVTFGTGFASTGTLATGTTSGRSFVVSFVSDGTRLLETSRTVAITV